MALCTRYFTPASSERGLDAVEGHQRVRGDCHGLKPDPQVEQVIGAAQANHGAGHGEQHGVELFFAVFTGDVGTGETG